MKKKLPPRRSDCPITYALDFIGDKWTLVVLRDLIIVRKRQFRDFLASDEKIASNILSSRLKLLEAAGMVTRRGDPEHARHVIYEPSEKGFDLLPTMLEMVRWSAKYDSRTAAPPAIVRRIARDRDAYIAEIRSSEEGARRMATSSSKTHMTDKRLRAFVLEVTATLLEGKPHRTPGLGTFATCTRRASKGRAACKMAMFRASAELREYASGGPPPAVSGRHAEAATVIIEAMQSEMGVNVPLLGRMAVVPVPGKKPKLIFHGAEELNDVLAAS